MVLIEIDLVSAYGVLPEENSGFCYSHSNIAFRTAIGTSDNHGMLTVMITSGASFLS